MTSGRDFLGEFARPEADISFAVIHKGAERPCTARQSELVNNCAASHNGAGGRPPDRYQKRRTMDSCGLQVAGSRLRITSCGFKTVGPSAFATAICYLSFVIPFGDSQTVIYGYTYGISSTRTIGSPRVGA